ncbi:hypothetical protein [Noviherbaspirillum cavernae]|uniref:hypothetical protein n=1 Tax=Noviherbaspirillum cavernae TaxID=2320862 RepID=UPI0018F2AE58|nr:hypothetical protein [Noviherbaspirillum cavernae]
MEDSNHNPMKHPEEQPAGTDDAPRFGRLLIILVAAVLFVMALTFVSEWLYT